MKPETKKRIVALYETAYGDLISNDYYEGAGSSCGWVLVSRPLEIEFELLSKEVIVSNKVEAIDDKIEEIKAKALQEINKLTTAKQELLALTNNKEN